MMELVHLVVSETKLVIHITLQRYDLSINLVC